MVAVAEAEVVGMMAVAEEVVAVAEEVEEMVVEEVVGVVMETVVAVDEPCKLDSNRVYTDRIQNRKGCLH